MNIMIIDEISDLLDLYALPKPSEEQVDCLLSGHFARFGRVGFESVQANADMVKKAITQHIARGSADELSREGSFLRTFLASDYHPTIKRGLSQALSVLPEQHYENPTIAFLLNSPLGDGKVTGANQFCINLQGIFWNRRNLSGQELPSEVLLDLESLAAHEGNHTYLSQLHYPQSNFHPLFCGLFREGLATFVQTRHYAWHEKYLASVEEWYLNIMAAIRADSKKEQLNVLKKIADNPFLGTQQPEVVAYMYRAIFHPEELNDKLYNELLFQALVKKNGAVYHVGCYMWRRIGDNVGTEGIKAVVAQGPMGFLRAYDEAAQSSSQENIKINF